MTRNTDSIQHRVINTRIANLSSYYLFIANVYTTKNGEF